MKLAIRIFVLILSVTVASPVYAHSGRTDSNGGHTCRTNCEKYGLQYGQYHVHTPKIKATKVVIKSQSKTKSKSSSKSAQQ